VAISERNSFEGSPILYLLPWRSVILQGTLSNRGSIRECLEECGNFVRRAVRCFIMHEVAQPFSESRHVGWRTSR
jgi:hypothetical protein